MYVVWFEQDAISFVYLGSSSRKTTAQYDDNYAISLSERTFIHTKSKP